MSLFRSGPWLAGFRDRKKPLTKKNPNDKEKEKKETVETFCVGSDHVVFFQKQKRKIFQLWRLFGARAEFRLRREPIGRLAMGGRTKSNETELRNMRSFAFRLWVRAESQLRHVLPSTGTNFGDKKKEWKSRNRRQKKKHGKEKRLSVRPRSNEERNVPSSRRRTAPLYDDDKSITEKWISPLRWSENVPLAPSGVLEIVFFYDSAYDREPHQTENEVCPFFLTLNWMLFLVVESVEKRPAGFDRKKKEPSRPENIFKKNFSGDSRALWMNP